MTLEVWHRVLRFLDALVAKRFASGDRVRPGKEMRAGIVSMLTRLIDRRGGNLEDQKEGFGAKHLVCLKPQSSVPASYNL
jgi:hypothetical protein